MNDTFTAQIKKNTDDCKFNSFLHFLLENNNDLTRFNNTNEVVNNTDKNNTNSSIFNETSEIEFINNTNINDTFIDQP